jgi:sensor histidine kinase YesM
MKGNRNNIDLVISGGGWRNFIITVIAAIPVFFVTYSYTDALMDRDDEKVAMFITIYFVATVYAGRYLSQLWINKNEIISKNILVVTGIIVIVSAALVFVLAQASLSSNQTFLRILFVGLPLTVLGLSSGVMIKLVRTTIKSQLLEAKANAEQSKDELRFLQSQLSPHFLFNTLNNMYGISLTQPEKIPALLLKLSDLLRYSVYDSKELFVPLKNELAYIKDYIEFEKIRIGDKLELDVTFEETVDPPVKIAPLLLIVFIENAFKHSKNTTEQKIYISITLKTWANSILFYVKNSCSGNTDENTILKKDSGFGLENVMKRIELLYKGEYDLKIQDRDGYYHVMLQLKAK